MFEGLGRDLQREVCTVERLGRMEKDIMTYLL
jgi:hypothetical protein